MIEMGALMIEAKAELPHGSFIAMVEEDLGIGERAAQMMMVVAAHPVLSNPSNSTALPSSLSTLYELSRIETPKLVHAIDSGVITPQVTRKQLLALRGVIASQAFSIFPCPSCGKPRMQLWHSLDDPKAMQVERLLRCRDCEAQRPEAPGLRTIERADGPYSKRALG